MVAARLQTNTTVLGFGQSDDDALTECAVVRRRTGPAERREQLTASAKRVDA